MSANLTYHWEGDYLIPNLAAPEDIPTGIWGTRRRKFLRQHRNGIYTGMLLSGKLNAHLAEIDWQATEMFERLTGRWRRSRVSQSSSRPRIRWPGWMP